MYKKNKWILTGCFILVLLLAFCSFAIGQDDTGDESPDTVQPTYNIVQYKADDGAHYIVEVYLQNMLCYSASFGIWFNPQYLDLTVEAGGEMADDFAEGSYRIRPYRDANNQQLACDLFVPAMQAESGYQTWQYEAHGSSAYHTFSWLSYDGAYGEPGGIDAFQAVADGNENGYLIARYAFQIKENAPSDLTTVVSLMDYDLTTLGQDPAYVHLNKEIWRKNEQVSGGEGQPGDGEEQPGGGEESGGEGEPDGGEEQPGGGDGQPGIESQALPSYPEASDAAVGEPVVVPEAELESVLDTEIINLASEPALRLDGEESDPGLTPEPDTEEIEPDPTPGTEEPDPEPSPTPNPEPEPEEPSPGPEPEPSIEDDADGYYQGFGKVDTVNGSMAQMDIHVKGLAKQEGLMVAFRITSYDPKKPLTITLCEAANHENIVQQETFQAETGIGKEIGSFTLVNVVPGDYYVIIEKPGHLSVTYERLSFSADQATAPDTLLIPGDIDGDGKTKLSDRTILLGFMHHSRREPSQEIPNPDVPVPDISDLEDSGSDIAYSDKNDYGRTDLDADALEEAIAEEQQTAYLPEKGADPSTLTAYERYMQEKYAADIDGDGKIDMQDINIMMDKGYYNKVEEVVRQKE